MARSTIDRDEMRRCVLCGKSKEQVPKLILGLHGGICVVFTYREEDVGPTHPLRALIAGFDRERRLSHVALPPLDAAGVERMIKALVPERATGELAQAVLERSEGVPYYVEELLKTAVDEAGEAPLV